MNNLSPSNFILILDFFSNINLNFAKNSTTIYDSIIGCLSRPKFSLSFRRFRFTRDMTQSREVLAMMDAHTTTFGRKRGCTVSPCGAFLFGAAVFISLVVTGLLVYHLAPCLEEKLVKPCGDFCNSEFEGRGLFNKDTYNKKKLDVRLPRSVVPDSYELKLIPFIQVGNFTFHGEVRIVLFFLSFLVFNCILERELSINTSRLTYTYVLPIGRRLIVRLN